MQVSADKINDILRNRFEVEVDFTCTVDELRDLMGHYINRRESIVESIGNDAAIRSADYVKAHLISEAVRMFLREIAPRRINRTKRKQS
jgi:hypothetical protein